MPLTRKIIQMNSQQDFFPYTIHKNKFQMN